MPAAFAPGRVNLIGEHTDYSGGLVLPAAIQLGVTVDFEPAERVELVSETHGPAPAFAADGSDAPPPGWARYAHAVAAELAELGRPAAGIAGTVSSDLPAGSGLSSSAALEVAVALALCTAAELDLDPLQLALACQRAELRAVGVPCGILDQAASVLGRDGEAVLLDCATLEHRPVAVPADATFLVVDSGAPRSLESTEYARRRAELAEALRRIGVERSTEASDADVERLDGVLRRRLRHVVTENARVLRFVDVLAAGDLRAAGELLLASHASLRDDYEVSIPALDELVAAACDAGALGARLLGGGFGGSVLALVETVRADDVAAGIADRYGRGEGALRVRPSAGARVTS